MLQTTLQKINRKMLVRISVAVLGIAMTCVSVSAFYLIGLGSDPYQVFCVAVHQRLNISHGMANNLVNGVIILFMLCFKRSYIKTSLFICLLTSGSFVDFFNALLTPVLSPALPMVVKLCVMLAGCFLMGAGIFLYIAPELGASPGDSMGLIVSDMVKRPYAQVRIGIDAFYTLVGFLLGATVGITTLCSILLTCPCIGLCKKWFENTAFIRSLKPEKAELS
ncbi:MAG: hypothetical protein RSE54_11710 [Ruthenibacterium sp.]